MKVSGLWTCVLVLLLPFLSALEPTRAQFNALWNTHGSGWKTFVDTHKKQYSSEAAAQDAFFAYVESKQFVDAHNDKFKKGEVTFNVSLNHLADLTPKEYRRVIGSRSGTRIGRPREACPIFQVPLNAEIPESLNWRALGYVSEVKDQGMCGSGWAFSAVGAVEGQMKRGNGTLVALSAQHLIDCIDSDQKGCDNADFDQAFQYPITAGGLYPEEVYPYEATDTRPCRVLKGQQRFGRTQNYYGVSRSPYGLKGAVATQGPVSTYIDASLDSFKFYSGGVYNDPKCTVGGQGVLVVGYGTDPVGGEYWLVKNSWGTGWGEEGYARVSKAVDCGITQEFPIFPMGYLNFD